MATFLQRRPPENTEFLSQISSSVLAGEADLKLVSEEGQSVLTHRLLLSLHSPLMRSLVETSEGTVTVCVPVASETLTSLVSLLKCGEVKVDGESVFFEEDEVSEAATILGIDLQKLKVEHCTNQESDESLTKKEMLEYNFPSAVNPTCFENICDVKEEQVNISEIKTVETKPPRNYRKFSGAELWLFENYPELLNLWRQSCDNEKEIENTSYSFQNLERTLGPTCRVCNTHAPTIGLHYGVRMCESDKQFLKRTFHHRVLYPPCAHARQPGLCPPRSRGWCQACRLRRCLSTPLTLHLVRVGQVSNTKTS